MPPTSTPRETETDTEGRERERESKVGREARVRTSLAGPSPGVGAVRRNARVSMFNAAGGAKRSAAMQRGEKRPAVGPRPAESTSSSK